MPPTEMMFEVTEAINGGYDVKALGYGIFTQGNDWADLKAMAKDAVLYYFDEGAAPRIIKMNTTNKTFFEN